jgi:hypothetical protein
MKNIKISDFFKRKVCENASTSEPITISRIEELITSTPQPVQVPKIEEMITYAPQSVQVSRIEEATTSMPQRVEVLDDFLNSVEHDPGKRSIWSYSPNQVDQIRRAYLKWGSYRIRLEEYPLSSKEDHPRRFQHTWFDIFPYWLEYSPSKDITYCLLLCYLFTKEQSVFITTGFRGWKIVRDGKKFAFLKHIGKDSC